MASHAASPEFTVADAFRIAREGHEDKVDKTGKPYIGHIWRVMGGVEGDTDKAAAALHDYLEDVDPDPQGLLGKGVPAKIVEAVQELSKREDEEGSDEGYFRFVRRAAANPIARKVKRADLADNTDPERVRVFEARNQALAAELRQGADGFRRDADKADEALGKELRKVADQFDERAEAVEAKPAALKAKYDAAIRILEEIDRNDPASTGPVAR